MSPKQVFVREATGLVREVDLKGATIFNALFCGFPQAASATILVLVPFMFPAADFVLAFVLLAAGLTFNCLLYAMMTAAMPRSGGEYVFLSRILGPSIGFAVNFAWVFVNITWFGWNISINTAVISSIFTALAPATGNPAMAALASAVLTPSARVAVGLVLVVAGLALSMMPVGRYMQILVLSVGGGLVLCSVTSVSLFLMATPSSFQTLFNQYMSMYSTSPNPFQEVLDRAYAAGYGGPQPATLNATLPAMAMALIYLTVAFMSSYVGGEIKRGGELKTHLITMLFGGVYLIAFLQIALWILLSKVLGLEFMGASAYLYFTGQSTIPTDPYYYLFSFILAGSNVPLLIVMFIGFFMMTWVTPSIVIMPARCMFAWAFDRLAPEKLAEVSERFRTPVWSVLITIIVGFVFTVWMVSDPTSYITVGTISSFVILVLFIAVAIAGIVFPYRRKSIFEVSRVGFAAKKIGKIPLISLIGVISLCFVSWVLVTYFANPQFTGYTWFTWAIMIVLYGGCIAYYYAVARYRKNQGIDLALVFREVPPE